MSKADAAAAAAVAGFSLAFDPPDCHALFAATLRSFHFGMDGALCPLPCSLHHDLFFPPAYTFLSRFDAPRPPLTLNLTPSPSSLTSGITVHRPLTHSCVGMAHSAPLHVPPHPSRHRRSGWISFAVAGSHRGEPLVTSPPLTHTHRHHATTAASHAYDTSIH